MIIAEYIWIDGTDPVRTVRSKTIILNPKSLDHLDLSDFPEWSFDGSSTNQATGHDSDCIIKPVNFFKDPLRDHSAYLVLCEVFNPDGEVPHVTNTRASLRKSLESAKDHECWIGYEQEYTLLQTPSRKPLGWPESGYPAPQGPYYCAVGSDRISGRELVEHHLQACIDAGIMIYGVNAEVMLGQWEFQIGYRGIPGENADPLNVADHVWVARWLMHRLGEEYDIIATFENKPMKGDWNGAGMHTNFSTKATRNKDGGLKAIEDAVEKLSKNHKNHIEVYGHNLHERLTGFHETCSIDEFRSGVANRGASIRIPRGVATAGHGYLEDRRPGANSDPYEVATSLINTVCLGLTEKIRKDRVA